MLLGAIVSSFSARSMTTGWEAWRKAPQSGGGLDVILSRVVKDAAAFAARHDERSLLGELAEIGLRVDVVGDVTCGR
jgi:hypothetical protein